MDIELCDDLTFYETVDKQFLKFYTNDGEGTSKNYLDRANARRIGEQLIAWANSPLTVEQPRSDEKKACFGYQGATYWHSKCGMKGDSPARIALKSDWQGVTCKHCLAVKRMEQPRSDEGK